MGGRGAYWDKVGQRAKQESKESKGESRNIAFESKQVGRKISKHAHEFGLDPKDNRDRAKFLDITKDIIDGHSEKRQGTWRSQPNPCVFYIKGTSVVVVNANNEYVTTMKNGVINENVKRGKKI